MKASVIGATGFAGAELLRLLDGHPEVELAAITSESSTGENIAAMYPHLSVRIETALGNTLRACSRASPASNGGRGLKQYRVTGEGVDFTHRPPAMAGAD